MPKTFQWATILSLWEDYKEVFTAMQFALEHKHNQTNKLFQFKLFADNIKTVDAYKLTRIICRQVGISSDQKGRPSLYLFDTLKFQFERGIFALMGTRDRKRICSL
ncbi:hypothetical protein TCAL_16838 [Tigriopus californicus]|uniref:Uncharacterized protein n=1 Tax=Tigriopus californicus TaxID=6832 RepID=A0A553PC50_TIGCA|nr:hypothetical protein TCAL_16838 [Tigriopus californicus]